MSNRLKETYQKEIVGALMKKFGYKNIMQVPKMEKVVINMGIGIQWQYTPAIPDCLPH